MYERKSEKKNYIELVIVFFLIRNFLIIELKLIAYKMPYAGQENTTRTKANNYAAAALYNTKIYLFWRFN